MKNFLKDKFFVLTKRGSESWRQFCSHVARQSRRTKIIQLVLICLIIGGGIWFWVDLSRRVVADPFGHSAKFCSIADYGADKEDSAKTKKAFQAAFAECAPGGTVVVPRGSWRTGGILIPSDVTLRFDYGSILSFDSNPAGYLPVVPTRFEGMDVMNYMPLLYAPHVKNVAVIGHGKLMGNGQDWWGWRKTNNGIGELVSAKELYAMAKAGAPIEDRVFGDPQKLLRTSFLQFYKSENIVVDGPTFVDGPMWTIHPLYSKNVTLRNVKVDTNGPNTDGVAIDSSENVTLENSEIASGDDAIVVKSGLDDDGWRQNVPAKHVVIRDVEVTRGNGGVTIGSEMSGGIDDVRVENVTFDGVDTGIRIKTLKGRGGFIRNINYQNVSMRNIKEDAVQINTEYKYSTIESQGDALPIVENITLNNISAKDAGKAFRIFGSSESPIRNLSISDVQISAEKAGSISEVDTGSLKSLNVTFTKSDPLELDDVRKMTLGGDWSKSKTDKEKHFARLRGSRTEDVNISVTPCPKQVCVESNEDVSVGTVHFSGNN